MAVRKPKRKITIEDIVVTPKMIEESIKREIKVVKPKVKRPEEYFRIRRG